MSLPEIVGIKGAQSRRFLRDLRDHPFVAIVLDEHEDACLIYTKGLDGLTPEGLRTILSTADRNIET